MSNTEVSTYDQDLADFLANAEFGDFQVPFEASLKHPELQYMKGVTVIDGRKEKAYTGWCIQTEQNAEVDAIFDRKGFPVSRLGTTGGH
jgi:hypothetical protein